MKLPADQFFFIMDHIDHQSFNWTKDPHTELVSGQSFHKISAQSTYSFSDDELTNQGTWVKP